MSKYVKKSDSESLEILREYLSTSQSQRAVCQKYGLHHGWIRQNLIKFAVSDKKGGVPMKRLPINVSLEKICQEQSREDLLQRIHDLELELRKAEMARDAYDEMIRLAEQYYNLPIRKKSGAK